MDVDLDGCIDDACGLISEVWKVETWFMPRFVLHVAAVTACMLEKRGKLRAAAMLLRSFRQLVWAYMRVGWIGQQDGQRLRDYAQNAREAMLGDLGGLDCPE
ncbi:MAG: hypothetical protein JXR96_00005 [Deltaproteobacteria bacterium]|nr:hypothetical protein [Deltaproteobacteria bacterium]